MLHVVASKTHPQGICIVLGLTRGRVQRERDYDCFRLYDLLCSVYFLSSFQIFVAGKWQPSKYPIYDILKANVLNLETVIKVRIESHLS